MATPCVILYIAASVDGFIARKDGDVSWLDPFNNQGEDYGYKAFMEDVDVSIMGSRAYEQLLTFEETGDDDGKKLYVITSRELPKKNDSVELYSGDLVVLVSKLKATTEKNIWLVGGSQLITSFINQGLVDEIMLFVVPVMLKEGIPLFANIENEMSFRLLESRSYATGLVKLHYEVAKSAESN